MKRILALVVALLMVMPSLAIAEGIDLTHFSDEGLNRLEQAIAAEREARANAVEKETIFTDQDEAPTAEQPVFKPLRKGESNENNSALQQKLKDLGYLTGKVDGVFGLQTEMALMALQAEMGWEQTGIVDSLDSLNLILSLGSGDDLHHTELGNPVSVSINDEIDPSKNLATQTDTPVTVAPIGANPWCDPHGFFPTSEDGMAALADLSNEYFIVAFDWETTGVDTAVDAAISLRYTSDKTWYTAVGHFAIPVGDSHGHCVVRFTPTDEMRQFGYGWLVGEIGNETNRDMKITLSNFKFFKEANGLAE